MRSARPAWRRSPSLRRHRGLQRRKQGDDPVRAILRAPVDLLWFGGIGTYVRGHDETDAEVGDRANDAVRTRPPVVQNVTISDVTASNVTLNGVTASCFQAIVAQGPVAFDYNGTPPTPSVQPISGVTISNCDFGTPVASGTATVTSPGPIYAFNVNAMTLANVTIAGQAVDATITDKR